MTGDISKGAASMPPIEGVTQDRDTLLRQVSALTESGGDWSSDIPLPFGVWTGGNRGIPHTRLKRVLQIAHDLSAKPLSQCRVLDLGSLEGLFAIEFALQGASVVGIEVRGASVRKAEFCRDALGLKNLSFVEDDVRNVSLERFGEFDIIVCSGILYHLPAEDVFRLARTMHEMSRRQVIVDTHVSLAQELSVEHDGRTYWGKIYREHADGSTQAERAKSMWASWDNPTSFWFTRPSLVNLFADAGFPSVYECFASPPRPNEQGLERGDRCTFAAIKGDIVEVRASPNVNGNGLRWSEGNLSYAASRAAR
jgi:hypothetical protein